MKHLGLGALLVAAVACSGNSGNPIAPLAGSPAGTAPAAADGTTLKAVAPVAIAPKDGATVSNVRPTLEFQAAAAKYPAGGASPDFAYHIELYEVNTRIAEYDMPVTGGATIRFEIPNDLKHNTLYRWRVRPHLDGTIGPYSVTADFRTPAPPAPQAVSGVGGGQPFGPTRSISVNEAFNIIVGYHNASGADLGSRSTRESRVAFLWAAVAIIHYGHPVFNPNGGDRDWCVKDAGSGRPPSDDVLVRCSTRDSWDLVGGAGANGYNFHLDYIGRLPGDQNVYPPPISSLPR